MRFLACCRETYPVNDATSFVLLHQSMALQQLGHEMHLYNPDRSNLRLLDYLAAFDFDVILTDLELLVYDEVWRTLRQYRRMEAVRVIGALYRLPPPRESAALDLVDWVITPWRGRTVEALGTNRDIRYLPLAYNASLHVRRTALPDLGPVFVGNTSGARQDDAQEYLKPLIDDRAVLCVGPTFEQKYLDPFAVGPTYAAARCLPNFHYAWEKRDDLILNERFWQTASSGVPVNDYSPLMDDVWPRELLEEFSFSDRRHWQERIRALNSGDTVVSPDTIAALGRSLIGHSYIDRMRQLLAWMESP